MVTRDQALTARQLGVLDIVGIGDFKNLTNAGAWLDFAIFAAHLVGVPPLRS